MVSLRVPHGKSFFQEATFDVRRKLEETFRHFGVDDYQSVIGESLLRLERVARKATRKSEKFQPDDDGRTQALFAMLSYYKSLK